MTNELLCAYGGPNGTSSISIHAPPCASGTTRKMVDGYALCSSSMALRTGPLSNGVVSGVVVTGNRPKLVAALDCDLAVIWDDLLLSARSHLGQDEVELDRYPRGNRRFLDLEARHLPACEYDELAVYVHPGLVRGRLGHDLGGITASLGGRHVA